MKKKILLISLCFCILILIFGSIILKKPKPLDKITKNSSKISEKVFYKALNLKESNSNEVILKSGIINEDITIVDVENEKTFYGYKTSGELCTYDTETKKIKPFKKAINKNLYIDTIDCSHKWIVWVESPGKEITDESTGVGWIIYAENKNTGEVIQIDKDVDKDIVNLPFGFKCCPAQICIFDDNIVYLCFKRDKNRNIKAVVNLFNLKNKSIRELDSNKDINKYCFSAPSIYKENIVWSVTNCLNDNRAENKSDIILYDIKTNNKKIISKSGLISSPIINKNFVSANYIVNKDKSNIVLYNLNKENDGWRNYINSSLPIYDSGDVTASMWAPLFSDDYMIWRDNDQKAACVVNTKNNHIYVLDKSKDIQILGIYNKIIFWREYLSNKSTLKYAILK